MADTPIIHLVVDGAGVSPKSVPLRVLVELLEAMMSAVEAIAEESDVEVPTLQLKAVRNGSAAYHLTSESRTARPVLASLQQAAKKRGALSSPQVRRALDRLHSAGRIGPVKIVPVGKNGRPGKPIVLAAPVDLSVNYEYSTVVYGKVVGILAKHSDTTAVRIRAAEGGSEDFVAMSDTVAASALSLFNQSVVAEVTFDVASRGASAGRLESLSLFDGPHLTDVIEQASRALEEAGIHVDTATWLAEIDA